MPYRVTFQNGFPVVIDPTGAIVPSSWVRKINFKKARHAVQGGYVYVINGAPTAEIIVNSKDHMNVPVV